MSEESKNTWFFMPEYPKEDEKSESTLDTLHDQITQQNSQIEILSKRVENLEQYIIPKMDDMDNKLEKLIQSHKSLIAYFGSVSGRDTRELNYKIRSYASKNKLPPTSFVPERMKTDI